MIKIQKHINTILSFFYYTQIIKKIQKINSNIFFVFPTYQIGGSERVHADIMSLVAYLQPSCIITSIPINNGFEKDFGKSANIIELKRWGSKKAFMPIMSKQVAKVINKQKNAVIFGSNSNFLYALIPHLKPHVKIIDLTHAFSEHCNGMELYSLPFVGRINQRIVLGNKTLNDYKRLYKKHQVPEQYLDRFTIIPNQVKTPDKYIRKDYTLPVNIIFVSRNSQEKRAQVFFKIVEECIKQQIPVTFTVVGDFSEYQKKFQNHIFFTGEIKDKDNLNIIYEKAHLILITSIIEGFPMVLLEGMAYGVVPISTDVGEIPNYISQERNTGFLIDNNLEEFDIINKFVGIIKECVLKPEVLNKFSETGFKMIKEKFNSEKFKSDYLEILT